MATIALYREPINRMPGLLRDVGQTVTDYQNELSALKRKVLKINKSICNLDDVICRIQASTRLQEEKSDSLEKLKQRSEEFTQEAVRIDEAVAEVVRQRSDHFYEKYGYLKPECRKSWTDQAKEWFTKAGAWCREHWKAVASVVLVIAAVVLLCTGVGGIIGAIALGALLGGAIGGVGGGLISMAMGGTFWEGFEDGAFAGVIGGMLSGGMGFAIAGKAALSLGETIAVGAVSGGGISFVNDMGSIIIGGERLTLGEVIQNTLSGGIFGGVFAGIGYGISKACAGLWNRFVGRIKGSSSPKTIPQQLTQEGQVPAIGKMKDLNAHGAIAKGEFKVADYLPNMGNPKANWQQNSGILRSIMKEGVPIKDVSMFPMDNAGFLGAERNLLMSKGWTYLNGYWYSPQY